MELAIVDSFETPVNRPSLQEKQKRIYKKQHTLKTQIISDQDGEVLTIDAGHRGSKADLNMKRLTSLRNLKASHGSQTRLSKEHPEIRTPHKKPKGGELTLKQKGENKEIASKRIVVEHAIHRVKGWRIVRDQYRLALGLFPMVALAVVGLVQLNRIVTWGATWAEVCLPQGGQGELHVDFVGTFNKRVYDSEPFSNDGLLPQPRF